MKLAVVKAYLCQQRYRTIGKSYSTHYKNRQETEFRVQLDIIYIEKKKDFESSQACLLKSNIILNFYKYILICRLFPS